MPDPQPLSRLTAVMQEAVDGGGFRDAAETEWATRAALERIRELEWDVSTVQTTRDEAVASATMPLRRALAQADAEVTALADALRAAGVAAPLVRSIIDNAKPRETSGAF